MTAPLKLELPTELLESAQMTLDDVKLELAVLLFQKDRISLGRAAAFAGLALGEFITALSSRHITPGFGDPESAKADAELLGALAAGK